MMPDLHPEELLDRARRGGLDEGEQALLEVHLARCAACRFELQAAADFAAMPAPALDVDSLVTNALLARATEETPGRRRPSRRSGMAVAAAVATFALGSFAAVRTGVLPRLIAAVTGSPAPSAEPTASLAARPVAPQVVPPLELAEPAPPPAPVEPLVVPPAPAAGPRRAHVPGAARASVSAPASVVRPEVAAGDVEPPATPDIPPPPPETASGVFAAATRSRVLGQAVQATAEYRRLLKTWPGSPEAEQAHAILGRLLLDEGELASALAQLDAYLAGGDRTLREEVLTARALTLLRLGREGEEQGAWQALLREFPESLHAERARARLGAGRAP